MGRLLISLSEEHENTIKQMHKDGKSFFELYRQVLNWDYNMKEATFKRILSSLLEETQTSIEKQSTSSTKLDKGPDMLEIYPESVPDSMKKDICKSIITNDNASRNENLAGESMNEIKNDTAINNAPDDSDSISSSDRDTETNNTSHVDKEEKNNNEKIPLAQQEDIKTSDIENTTITSDENILFSQSQCIQSTEDLSKKIDCLSNDIQSILKKIDSINGTLIKLEQKNPNKIIKQNADDFIRIYADERKSTSINLNIKLKEAIESFGKNFNVKTLSDAINLALLVALYTYEDTENIKSK